MNCVELGPFEILPWPIAGLVAGLVMGIGVLIPLIGLLLFVFTMNTANSEDESTAVRSVWMGFVICWVIFGGFSMLRWSGRGWECAVQTIIIWVTVLVSTRLFWRRRFSRNG